MVKAIEAKKLAAIRKAEPRIPVIGVFSPCDPRIDNQSRVRVQNIIAMTANTSQNGLRINYSSSIKSKSRFFSGTCLCKNYL